jgi:hypothetical protein
MYVCPPEIIQVSDIPENFGLVYIGNQIEVVVKPVFVADEQVDMFYERTIVKSIIRRLGATNLIKFENK